MPTLSDARLVELLGPYVASDDISTQAVALLSRYLDLLIKWNARTNLTAVRAPEELVQRQVGESLFAVRLIGEAATLLDFGSGAGFPGIPLQIARPQLRVTLAESQGKKASFLREAVRALDLPSEVWAKRVEEMPAQRVFDVVAMRAVDATEQMLSVAAARVAPKGILLRYVPNTGLTAQSSWQIAAEASVPLSTGSIVCFKRASDVDVIE